jgi:hypothetical protein
VKNRDGYLPPPLELVKFWELPIVEDWQLVEHLTPLAHWYVCFQPGHRATERRTGVCLRYKPLMRKEDPSLRRPKCPVHADKGMDWIGIEYILNGQRVRYVH